MTRISAALFFIVVFFFCSSAIAATHEHHNTTHNTTTHHPISPFDKNKEGLRCTAPWRDILLTRFAPKCHWMTPSENRFLLIAEITPRVPTPMLELVLP